MAENSNKVEKQSMDPELFEMLDQGLRELFKKEVERNQQHGSWQQTPGLVAAQSAQALIDLHSKFEPGS